MDIYMDSYIYLYIHTLISFFFLPRLGPARLGGAGAASRTDAGAQFQGQLPALYRWRLGCGLLGGPAYTSSQRMLPSGAMSGTVPFF